MNLNLTITVRFKFRQYIILSVIVFFNAPVIAQNNNIPIYHLKKATGSIIIDGDMSEPDWQGAEVASGFFQNYPYDTAFALSRTEVRATYDDKNIYFSAVCYDSLPGDNIIRSLKRDYSIEDNDGFAIYIDPYNDKSNGYVFAVNAFAVQMEGLLESGSQEPVSAIWDNKWFSEVKRIGERWAVEIAIPFKTIKFKEGITTWRVNFARNDLKRNERSTWVPVPRNFKPSNLGYTGTLAWDTAPGKSGTNVSIIPYAIGDLNKKYNGSSGGKRDANAGFDAKVAVTSSLNLDVTVNPDFSQVEVDQQQVNLTRFNLFYPEKRQFFIENSDLFSNFGFSQIRPFFSRKIGLYQGQTVPIIAGARLSGKTGKNLRVGAMDIQTAQENSLNLNAQNYSVLAFQHLVMGRSNIAAIIVNRQANKYNRAEFSTNDFNRVAGIDFNLLSDNNRWQGKIFYHTSFTPERMNNNYATAGWLMYSTKNLFWMWNHEYVGKNYIADAGFVPRNITTHHETGMVMRQTYARLEPMISYKFYTSSGIINYHGPAFYSDDYFDSTLAVTDYFFMPHYIVNFRNTSDFQVHFHNSFTELFYDTDISFSGKKSIPAGNYYYRNLMMKYQSDRRKVFSYFLQALGGSHYNGNIFTLKFDVNYRYQPWMNFSLGYSRDQVRMPYPYENFSIMLITQKTEVTFSPAIYFTLFTQYNTQINNMNLNARFQWRFRPMSDFYIVYSGNYSSSDLSVKDHAVVAKLIWWMTM
ncbi:MAG: carbohydrate binding family 9 domain-containing protein [Bacteroidetes bacterium]|nr:carbohydrate binding family 9 domain-containing protein [Bacteroidota bacterium]